MKINIKNKLILNFTILIILTGTISTIIGTVMINRGILNEVQGKVYTDLYSARGILNNRLNNIRNILESTALRELVKNSISNNDRRSLLRSLQDVKEITNFEILVVTDKDGRVIIRTQNPEEYRDSQAEDPLIKKVLTNKKAIASPVIIKREDLIKEGQCFADRAKITIVSDYATKTNKTPDIETSGMMLKAAVPIFDDNRHLLGIIYGGDLLNGNYGIVDKIKETVYQGEVYKNHDMGTATIFQDDIRISTNVLTGNGERAIGTRVSREVYDRVIKDGKQWIDRAMVVNSRYITAYEPIRNIDNKVIGMLYVGMLQDKYIDFKWRLLLIFFAVTITGMLLVFVISNFLANTITKPIKHLANVSRQISEGNFSVEADIHSNDEIGELVKAFNKMAHGLMERDEKLKDENARNNNSKTNNRRS